MKATFATPPRSRSVCGGAGAQHAWASCGAAAAPTVPLALRPRLSIPLPLPLPARRGRSRPLRLDAAAASGAAALGSTDGGQGRGLLTLTYQDILARGPSRQAPLPPPPKAATFAHVLPYLFRLAVSERDQYWRVGAAFVCLLISKVAGMLCPLMIKRAVDSFTVHAGEPLAAVVGAATHFVLLYGLCDVAKNVAKELQAPLFTPVSQNAARRVSMFTFAHVLDLDVRFHLERRTGRLSRILERGMRSIQMLYRAAIFTFTPTALELAFVCGVLAKAFSPLVGGLVLATFAAYVTWSIVMTSVATDARKHVNELDNATSAKAVDALLSYETVTLFNNQALEVGQYNAYLKQYMRACVTTDRLSALLNAGQAIILAVGLTAIITTALHTVGPSINPGDLVMIQGLLLQLWAPLQYLGWFYRELRSALVDMEDFFAILRTKSNLVDGASALPAQPPQAAAAEALGAATAAVAAAPSSNGTGNGAAAHVSGAAGEEAAASGGLLVELEDVHFGYSPDRQILKGLSLRVEPGKSLALVGPSGSGKSTVLRLLTRLYDCQSGAVRLNGQDVRDTQLRSLRDAVALVPQETMLFNDSIMQNIRYGRPAATDDEVVEAAKLAHLHEAVMRMPKGYATVVGERGLKLSGGEKQRVAIARAFLRQPRLLICDEATSALDSGTEAQIMTSLAELAVGRTSVFVAHRLSTIKDCDTVAVLRDGRLVELGSHDELMAHPGGLYRSMWESQAARRAKQQEKRKQQQQEQLRQQQQQQQQQSMLASVDGGSGSSGSSMDEPGGHGGNGGASSPLPLPAGVAAAAAAAMAVSPLGVSGDGGEGERAAAEEEEASSLTSASSLPALDPLQLPAPDEVLAAGLLEESHHHHRGGRGDDGSESDDGEERGPGRGGALGRARRGGGRLEGEEEDALSSVASIDMEEDYDLGPEGLDLGVGASGSVAGSAEGEGEEGDKVAVGASPQAQTRG